MCKIPAQEAFPPIPAGHAFGRIFAYNAGVTGSIPVPPTPKVQVQRLLAHCLQSLSVARPRKLWHCTNRARVANGEGT